MHDAAIRTPTKMALFLDVDGTLLDFAQRPNTVRVPDDLPAALLAASHRLGGALALISGRPIKELDALFAPATLPVSGLHGAEMRLSPGAEATVAAPLPPQVAVSLRIQLAGMTGIEIEDKGASLAVHFRAAPAIAAELRDAVFAFLARADIPALEVLVGEMVYELKPGGFDKGTALSRFMQLVPFAGKAPVFVADHPIDQAAFDAAAQLGGMGLSVGRLLPGAAGWFSSPTAVREWLKTAS